MTKLMIKSPNKDESEEVEIKDEDVLGITLDPDDNSLCVYIYRPSTQKEIVHLYLEVETVVSIVGTWVQDGKSD